MKLQSHHPAVSDARGHLGHSPRRHHHAITPPGRRVPDGAACLRFWRPLPREVADIICGEGAVDELPIHAHGALQVILPVSRFAVVDCRGTAVELRPGQVHIAAPMELHGVRRLDDAPCTMRVILVPPEVLPRLVEDVAGLWHGAPPEVQQLVVDDPAIHAELWALIGELRGPLVSMACGPRLLGALRRLLGGLSALPRPASVSREGRQTDGVARVRDHLRAHVAENVTLDELASVAGLSKFYLLRAFRRAHGITPHAYQMQLRLAHAWRFIVEGRPLSRATYDAGFADQSHLTRRFSAMFGLTPARYARQLAVPPATAPSAARPAAPSSAA